MDTTKATTELKKIDNLATLVADYELSTATAAKLRSQVDAVKTTILCTGVYRSEDGEQITNSKHEYLIADNDFERYLDTLDAALKSNRIKPFDMARDICPALVAGSQARAAKRELVNATAPALGIDADMLIAAGLGVYDQWVDLICKLSKTLI